MRVVSGVRGGGGRCGEIANNIQNKSDSADVLSNFTSLFDSEWELMPDCWRQQPGRRVPSSFLDSLFAFNFRLHGSTMQLLQVQIAPAISLLL